MQKSSENHKILIWGEAGVGKTTFASKLAQDWAEVITNRKSKEKDKMKEEQRHLLSNIGLVLYIVFRDTHENQSLDDIVQSQVFDNVGEKSVKVSQNEYQKEILLVCDGLDEVTYSENELLDIINGHKYSEMMFITTCRPHASLGMALTADAEIRLKGFSEEQAHHFVDMFFKMKHPNDVELAEKNVNEVWDKIISSPDLMEMAINPSMLQLLCKLFSITGNIAKDRATIFKDYTRCLLQHHHYKCEGKRITSKDSEKKYKEFLLKAGKLALQGLKQSHLQLVFTKEDVTNVSGNEVYDIGFVTEIPSSDDIPKAQFIHKSLQEYLAAFFIVNTPENVGMKYLMEFCSTSKGLMGSQIILTFITALSKKMGKIIQKQIRELVSSWASEDDISHKDRTSFLIAMLKENKSLVFPLPNEIEIDIREYEANTGWFAKVLQFFGKKNTLEKFFDFDNRGVQKVSVVLGEKFRLQLMKGFKNSSLVECVINFQKNVSVDDQIHLKDLIESNNKLEIISLVQLNEQGVLNIFNNKIFISSLEKSKHLKMIKIHESEFDMNTNISDALTHVPKHIALDLCNNKVRDQSLCKVLIQKAAHHEALIMQDCGIIIDTEIAKAISKLPEKANLDLSGNTVTKMDSSLLCHVIPVISNKKIDLSGLGVIIDAKVPQVLCSLDTKEEVNLSGNQITDKSACIALIHNAATMKSLRICNCGIQIDKEIAEAISCLPEHTQLDISGNQVTDKSVYIALIHNSATMKSLSICNCGIQIDTEIAESVSKLPDHTQLDLSGNQVTDKSVYITLIHKVGTMKYLSVCNCGIQIDTEIAEAVSRLPDHTQLDLSGNQVTDKSACITLIHKAVTMKSLNIQNCMKNCGMKINKKIAEAVSRLPDHTELDLSGNIVTGKSACITLIHKAATMKSLILCNCCIKIDKEVAEVVSRLPDHRRLGLSGNQVTDKSVCISLIYKAATMKSLSICNCGIQIDTEIAEAVSRLPDHTQLDLSGNMVTCKSACITLIHKAATMKFLILCNCHIQIDKEVAEVVSRLPEHTQLDLSGNQVTDKSACITLIHKAATMKSLNIHDCMSNCGIQIDTEIAEAVSRLPDHTQLDLSGNQVTEKSACITLIHKAATMKSLNIHNCMSNCGIQIDTEIAEAVSRLPDHTQLDLSGNQVTEKSVCISLIHKAARMKSLSICNCGIQIDTEIAEAVSRLPDHTQIDLSGNDITKMKPYLLSRILLYMTKQEKINIDGWGITVDESIVRALSKLSKLQILIFNYNNHSMNKLTFKAASELPHTVSSLPHLQVLHLYNCNISNDAMVTLTDSLYKHCPLLEVLSLHDNHLSSGVWEVVKHIQQMENLEKLWLSGNPCMQDYIQRDNIEKTFRSNPGLYVRLFEPAFNLKRC